MLQVPIIYSHSDHVRKGDLPNWLRQELKRPYVLITGQSDWAIPSSCSDNANQVLYICCIYLHISPFFDNPIYNRMHARR